MITVIVAAERASVRAGLSQLLRAAPRVRVAATASVAELFRLLAGTPAAVVVIHEALVDATDRRRLRALVAAAPQASFIVVGMHDHAGYVERVRQAGARDYVRLDDAERLNRIVVEAGERSAPSVAARRRTGSRAVSLVPSPGADSIASVPPSSSTRSRIPSSP